MAKHEAPFSSSLGQARIEYDVMMGHGTYPGWMNGRMDALGRLSRKEGTLSCYGVAMASLGLHEGSGL